MTEGEQLLRAALEEPGDDTVRLVYADWLEENGEPGRAAYIRRGVAICHPERLNPEHDMGAGWDGVIDIIAQYPPVNPYHCGLCRAIQEQRNSPITRAIAREVGDIFGLPADWSGRKDPGVPNYVGVRCRGGFASEVTCAAADFTEPAARSLFSRHPVQRIVFPGSVRDHTIFRGNGDGDFPPGLWARLNLPRCEIRMPSHLGADTHLHITEDELSAWLVRYGRTLVGLPVTDKASVG